MVSNVLEEVAYRDREFVFKDRPHAGALLADKLRPLLAGRDVQLLAVPAGGVAVGYAGCSEAQHATRHSHSQEDPDSMEY